VNQELKPLKLILRKQYFRYVKYLCLFAFFASLLTILISLHFERFQNCQSLSNRIVYLNDVFAREIIIGSTETVKFELKKLENAFGLHDIRFSKSDKIFSNSCSFTSLNTVVNHPIRFADSFLGHIVATQGSYNFIKISNLSFFIPLILIVVFSFLFITSLTGIFQKYFFDPLTKILNDTELVGVEKNNFKYDGDVSEFDNLKNKLNSMLSRLDQVNEMNTSLEKAAGIGELATQVAHDIRSPLEVLKGLKSEISILPETSRKRVQLSINRIEEITFNLLKTHKKNLGLNQTFSEELLSLVTSVMTEKKIEFRNSSSIEIEDDFSVKSYGMFSKVQRSTLKSIISNLINNSIDSSTGVNGKVIVSLFRENNYNLITVSDTGSGISKDLSSKLFTRGFTTKRNGNGLGLYNAKIEIEAVGGTISFESEVGKGATFTISLPQSIPPSTFVESIDTTKYERVIVLDDDPAFHEVWSKRLAGLESKVEHIHSVEEMFSKYQALHPKILLLSDFELMDKDLDGIDTILKLNHAEHSILVTARNEEQEIQDRCLHNGIKLLPKSLVNYVKVIASNDEEGSDGESSGPESLNSGLGIASIVGNSGGSGSPKGFVSKNPNVVRFISNGEAGPESEAPEALKSDSSFEASKLVHVAGTQGGEGESYKEYGETDDIRSGDKLDGLNQKPLVVLIDDDRLVHINWTSYCEKHSLPFCAFKSINAFLDASGAFDKASSRIFIDSNLGDGIKGEIESEKIFKLGFANLYLATGYEKDSIQKPAWIKEVYSKSPENIGKKFKV
jgi:signal transduction histidine kinase/CheY-like chemotaxis protein